MAEIPHLDQLLHEMNSLDASDLHVIVGLPPVFRVHGDLHLTHHPVLNAQNTKELIYEILSQVHIKEIEEKFDVDLAYQLGDTARFRVNVYTTQRGLQSVLRRIPIKVKSLDELFAPPIIKSICDFRQGLVLVTGPTGSGKSTTLAAAIDYINRRRDVHIITIEDPLEFVHDDIKAHITHREVRLHTESFRAALRAAGRQDADVLLIGEMRDLESMALAISSAELGLLVFATLHTNSAPKSVDRIIDAFPADQQPHVRAMLSESLKAVVAQQLLKRKGGHGRVAAFEVLVSTPALGNVIREGKSEQIYSLMQTGKQLGMQTMDESLGSLIKKGLIDPKEAYYVAHDKDTFKKQYLDNKAPI